MEKIHMRHSNFMFNQSPSTRKMTRLVFRRAICLSALSGLLTFTAASAKEPANGDAKANTRIKQAAAEDATAEATLPACLEKLKLTDEQQTQAKEIVGKYDEKIDAVWLQFRERYMETVKTEVSLLTAIEDNLTEPQQMKVREQRRRTAHTEQAAPNTSEKSNRGASKPADPAKQEIAAVGITLTSEQEAAADKVHQNYKGHLRSLHREVQALHARLVSLEADQVVEIEKILTKDQLAKLREERQTVSVDAKLSSKEKASTKTE
jgi:hypothetical protein